MAEIDEVFVVDCEVRVGIYPGETVSTHPSHWAACEEMMRRNAREAPPDAD